jgi:glycosyltransferase involved in cell wall biosynthesis
MRLLHELGRIKLIMRANMHLAVEAVGAKYGGGAVVLGDVVRAAIRCGEIERITIFCSPRNVRMFDMPHSQKLFEIPRPYAEGSALGRFYWLNHGLKEDVKAVKADMVACMNGIGSSPERIPMSVFIQQALPFCDEALGRCDLRTKIRMRTIGSLMKRSCNNAALIVTQTPTMSDWIRSACELTNVQIMVVKPWGDQVGMDTEQGGSVAAMLHVPAHLRLLYVGSSSRYKNLECLLSALPEIRRRTPGATLFLTCPADHPFCQSPGAIGLGYLGGNALRAAYHNATILVMPSLVESGNITLTEAMTMGTPIVAADRAYARDLCGDAAVYFDPNRPAELAAVISDLILNEEKRRDLVRRGFEAVSMGRSERHYDHMMERLVALWRRPLRSASNGFLSL